MSWEILFWECWYLSEATRNVGHSSCDMHNGNLKWEARGREIKVGTYNCKDITTNSIDSCQSHWVLWTRSVEKSLYWSMRNICCRDGHYHHNCYIAYLSVCLSVYSPYSGDRNKIRDSPSLSVVYSEWHIAVLQCSNLILYSHLCLSLPSGFFPSDSRYKASKQFFSMYAKCPVHLIFSTGWYSYLKNSRVTAVMIKWFSNYLLICFRV
jgi:hypothetical protein